jgi:hypothetical protein
MNRLDGSNLLYFNTTFLNIGIRYSGRGLELAVSIKS